MWTQAHRATYKQSGAFVVWAAMAKLRHDLDEEELDFVELEKLVNSEGSDNALSLEPSIIEEPMVAAGRPPGKAAQPSDPSAPAPVPYPQATLDVVLYFRTEAQPLREK